MFKRAGRRGKIERNKDRERERGTERHVRSAAVERKRTLYGVCESEAVAALDRGQRQGGLTIKINLGGFNGVSVGKCIRAAGAYARGDHDEYASVVVVISTVKRPKAGVIAVVQTACP